MKLRKTTLSDLARLREIFTQARKYMAETGNPNQWEPGYPSDEVLKSDIESGYSYVWENGGETVATFVMREGEDPTYKEIFGGEWVNSEPYVTIHRIASDGSVLGVFHKTIEFAVKEHKNIRIDTHRDNRKMRENIGKEGFEYCGVIHCWNGTERLAYQLATKD